MSPVHRVSYWHGQDEPAHCHGHHHYNGTANWAGDGTMPLEECPVQIFNFKGGIDMNRFTFAGLMLFALLLVAPIASAQVGSPSCSGGSAYDLTGHGCVTGYTNGSAAAASTAPKVAGLAAPAQAAQRNLGWPGCPWGAAYDPMAHGFIAECFWRPTDNAAALKPAGLAAPAPVAIPEQGWPGCPWGAAYDPMAHGYVPACFNRTADGAASPKTAGLAKTAPVEAFVPCGYGERLDPLALACQH